LKEIDETDSIILKTLLVESRTSFTELAKICGISVTAVIRRYTRLKKTGIILGEHMYLNPISVGYESIAEIGILTDLADKEKVAEKVAESLGTKSFVRFGTNALGKYDIYGLVAARKVAELSEIVQHIDIKPYVKSLDVLIFADLWDNPWHPENLIIKPGQENPVPNNGRPRKKFEPAVIDDAAIDDIDKNIAKMLMENSRVAFNEIAGKLKISTANVIERYHKLREKNVLNLSSITLDICKLGYNAIADAYIKVTNRANLSEVEAQLLKIPNLTFCAKFVGGVYDLRTAVSVSNFDDYFALKKMIYSIGDIKHAELYLFGKPKPWIGDFIGQTVLATFEGE
jgi:Lrp/AsnC family transcriptional regulator for asnA, asnC and gidA